LKHRRTGHTNNTVFAAVFNDQPEWLVDPDKHSVVYPIIRRLLVMAGTDAVTGLFRFNAVVDTLTIAPLFLLLRSRGAGAAAGFFSCLFFAVHPVLARFAPTDAHYPLLMFFWMSGCALLSRGGAVRVLSGLALLGLAASMRIEGLIYVAASPLLIGPRRIVEILRKPAPAAASLAGIAAVSALAWLQYRAKYPCWTGERADFLALLTGPGKFAANLIETLSFSATDMLQWSGPLQTAMAALGAAASFLSRRLRWGLGATAAYVLVTAVTYRDAYNMAPWVLHRAMPGFLLQCMLCGLFTGLLVDSLKGPRLKAAAMILLGSSVAVLTPVSEMEFLRREYEFNTEFRILAELRDPGRAKGADCSLLFVRPSHDFGLHEPEHVPVSIGRVFCDGTGNCLKKALEGGCVYYFRNAACYRTDLTNVKDGVQNPLCRDLEDAMMLEPVSEATADLLDSFGYDNYVGKTVIGLYRVKGPRDRTGAGGR
jgi:hypothetical protein